MISQKEEYNAESLVITQFLGTQASSFAPNIFANNRPNTNK